RRKELVKHLHKILKITARLSATSAGTSKKPSTSSRRTRKSARTNKSGPLKRWKSSHTRKPRKSRTSPAPRKKKFWRLSKLHGFGGTVFDGAVLFGAAEFVFVPALSGRSSVKSWASSLWTARRKTL